MADEPQGTDSGADAAAAADGTPVTPAAEKPWYERRIDELTANWRGEQRALAGERAAREIAEGALEVAKKGGAVIPPPAQGSPEFERAVNDRAMATAATLTFNAKCNKIAAEGAAKYQDFQASVGTWNRLGELTVPIVEAADETGHAADIIYELGKNPAEAERILKLPPISQVAAVMKFAQKYTGTPTGATRVGAISAAGEPVRAAVGGSARAQEPSLFDTDKLTTAQWIEQREADLERKASARGRRA